jgi:RNA polymerase sigma-70 factor, ECF subfamily
MPGPRQDIRRVMPAKSGAASSGDASAGQGRSGTAPLSPAEFAARLSGASRTLWLIAASVLGRRADAEDVVQESAVIGLQKIHEFQPDTNFTAWMGGIVRNVARNAARKTVRRHTGATNPADLDQSVAGRAAPTRESGFDRHGRLSDAQRDFDDHTVAALNKLEETARVCLLLRTIRQMPYREIAALLSIPEGTAMSHVHRARGAMREELLRNADEHGGKSGGQVG